MNTVDTTLGIRPAREADWPAIWPIFHEIATAGETYAFEPNLTADAARAFWLAPPPTHTVVALDGHSVRGTAKVNPNRPGPGSHVATASFMAGSSARGQGVGRALGEYAIRWAREQGYAAMQFNAVVESNAAAVALWQSLGFRIIGTVPAAFQLPSGDRVGLHIMHRAL